MFQTLQPLGFISGGSFIFKTLYLNLPLICMTHSHKRKANPLSAVEWLVRFGVEMTLSVSPLHKRLAISHCAIDDTIPQFERSMTGVDTSRCGAVVKCSGHVVGLHFTPCVPEEWEKRWNPFEFDINPLMLAVFLSLLIHWRCNIPLSHRYGNRRSKSNLWVL